MTLHRDRMKSRARKTALEDREERVGLQQDWALLRLERKGLLEIGIRWTGGERGLLEMGIRRTGVERGQLEMGIWRTGGDRGQLDMGIRRTGGEGTVGEGQ